MLATLFYEPSTRTSASFAAAALRLGATVLPIDVGSSSVAKGETLEDTIKCLGCYADAIVLRHPTAGAAAAAAKVSGVPLLNGGDGTGEHPSQALLDVFTMLDEVGSLHGRTVTLLGDLKHGRTVHSLVQVLATLAGATPPSACKLQLVSPPTLTLPSHLLPGLAALHPVLHPALTPELVACTNILYVTRVQKERFASVEEYDAVKGAYVVDAALLAGAPPPGECAVMHPLPRVGEISTDVDADPRAAYVRQMRNGLYVRMALLALTMGCTLEQIEAAVPASA